jgi:hypothetical protein
MQHTKTMAVADVAACTAAAAHRRDHRHADAGDRCHPHAVEVIGLGERGVAVCHDCGVDSGFLPRRDAERLASAHQHQTLADTASPHRLVAA